MKSAVLLGSGAMIGFLVLLCMEWIISQKKVKRKKKKMKKMDWIMIIIFLLVTVFTVTMIIVFIKCGSIPDTLVISFFGATLGECSAAGYIKGQNIKCNQDQTEDEPTRRASDG